MGTEYERGERRREKGEGRREKEERRREKRGEDKGEEKLNP